MGALFGHLATSPATGRYGSGVSGDELLSALLPHRGGNQVRCSNAESRQAEVLMRRRGIGWLGVLVLLLYLPHASFGQKLEENTDRHGEDFRDFDLPSPDRCSAGRHASINSAALSRTSSPIPGKARRRCHIAG